jgi:hypothetical protein
MADLYLKRLETERKSLWATCRLKGLPKMSAERERIAEIDRLIKAHKEKPQGSSLPRSGGEGDRSAQPDGGGASSSAKASPK